MTPLKQIHDQSYFNGNACLLAFLVNPRLIRTDVRVRDDIQVRRDFLIAVSICHVTVDLHQPRSRNHIWKKFPCILGLLDKFNRIPSSFRRETPSCFLANLHKNRTNSPQSPLFRHSSLSRLGYFTFKIMFYFLVSQVKP